MNESTLNSSWYHGYCANGLWSRFGSINHLHWLETLVVLVSLKRQLLLTTHQDGSLAGSISKPICS